MEDQTTETFGQYMSGIFRYYFSLATVSFHSLATLNINSVLFSAQNYLLGTTKRIPLLTLMKFSVSLIFSLRQIVELSIAP